MQLDFFKDTKNENTENEVQEFLKDINEFLEKASKNIREEKVFQVISGNPEHVYLQNIKTGETFEEKNLPSEIQNAVSEGFVLNYKNGKYTINEDLTDDYFENQISIKEYYEIRKKFLESNKIKENEKFTVESINDKNAILRNENSRKINVPKALLPYFLNKDQRLIYKKERFKINVKQ